ncbi:protein FAM161B [Gouania willdenowi]|uniref:FAM161 centrosomal protein B n=1 Tax=Gouania willdenowi TaxID=441366 RepID=A0A8C5ETU7_GOUWI|nr:protein FAM161B [Gouania willdenowi]XP_028294237.1 protein FAM161B [Gouania willdenowi]XP_028294238.1 protein FAM161B [Gouania willdenowi]XP_028294240.1 protein FAM161B [Gouania willdenowi]XP_028294241.1 protein FAM161B [Gouania willdenowi]
MSMVDNLLKDGLHSELILQQHLKSLRKTLKQQLQEAERTQTEELERRIEQNAVLCAAESQSGNDEDRWQTKSESLSNTIRPKKTKTLSPAVVSATSKIKNASGDKHCERFVLSKTTQQSKEEEAEAECQKKFRAVPVPDHINQPVYQEMVELREKGRKQGHEQRIQFLLSMQKPFSFQQREKEKRERLSAEVKEHESEEKKIINKKKKDPSEVNLKDQINKVRRKQDFTAAAAAPSASQTSNPKVRTAERTRKDKMGFLDEKPSFRPKIIQEVPDFSRFHKALQNDALLKAQMTTGTKCQPFVLRTAALPARKRTTNTENSQQVPQRSHLYRSKSHGALSSLSADTLPTFITDAARKRGMAIRKSLELRDSKNQESAQWLRDYQSRTESMKRSIALHAKLLDPHNSLKEVHEKKLQHHREADLQRMREYMRELREIKARVSERPYLFQQVKQKCAKAQAEQVYQSILKQAGLKEKYVEEIGQALTPEDETYVTDRDRDRDIHSGAESQGDGEKIEDVEEESVESKVEDVP